ncbi:GNAT family N-acetyltransferase [Candidatus Saccharibacteria bacterium]|nr:GNAT family N-acetyltransferase [Candidatus Saccharibacteria bacterium]
MTKKHVWRVKKEYFRQLKNGSKSLEIRVGYSQIKKVRQGDTITFENYGKNEFDVLRVSVYDSFERMLEAEGVKNVLPDMTFDGALRTLRDIYPKDRESLGVYAFELRFKTNDAKKPTIEFLKASDLLKAERNKTFSKLIAESYMITDWIRKDYPSHCDHFYGKYVPGIFDGEREVITCYVDGKIAATAFLKKDKTELKISTLYVKPEYQKRGIATALVERCFEWLGTTKPLITIADYKLDQFAGIIKKYGWEETQVLDSGYYNDHSREHVFNGTI